MKNINLSENFQFLVVKFSIYFNRHVFAMIIFVAFSALGTFQKVIFDMVLYSEHVNMQFFVMIQFKNIASRKHAYIIFTPLNPTFK